MDICGGGWSGFLLPPRHKKTFFFESFLSPNSSFIFSNNIFENNDSKTGNTFESIGYVGDIDFSDSFFDIFLPN